MIIDDVMKILQNEITDDSTTTSTTTTANSKEKQQHQQHTSVSSLQQQQSITEKRKAKTLKNKILQNVAQQQQQEENYQQQQRQHQQNAIVNNKYNAPSAMTDERTKYNYTNNYNNTKTNNSNTDDIKISTSLSAVDSNILKDSLKDSSSCGSNQNKNGSSNNNDLIIAEAAKILLKNGLNGTNAAAAAAVATATATLLTAAATFHQLPTATNSISTKKCDLTSSTTLSTSTSDTSTLAGNVTTAAATAHAQLVAIAAAAAAVNATNQKRLATATPTSTFTTPTSSTSTCKSSNESINNGLLDSIGIQATSATTSTRTAVSTPTTTHFTKPYKSSSCKSTMSSSMDMDIFDHAVNINSNNTTAVTSSSPLSSAPSAVINLSVSANNNINNSNSSISQQKYLNNIHSHANRSDIGRPSISQHHHQTSNVNNHKNTVAAGGGYGGRLQFFKDGKFILELARSKDGEKGGWVSVPRKIFRTPSAATSSTVTPSASASTSVAAIPSSLAASPAVVIGGTTYPKNECSNSLSFSDDNSSLQSSPWQRDHCWKQAAPRKDLSKELKLFYRRPVYHKFSRQAVSLSHRKRRKPYDTKTLDNDLVFVLNSKKQLQHQQNKQQVNTSTFIKKEVELTEEIKKKAAIEKEEVDKREDAKSSKTNTEPIKTEIVDGGSKNCDEKEEYNKTSDNKVIIKTETEILEKEDVDVEMTKLSSPGKAIVKETKMTNVQMEAKTKENDQFEKMNTSECADVEDDANTLKKSTTSNGDTTIEEAPHKKQIISVAQEDYLKKGDEEKRLKKHENVKTRAKLTTIVQKLIDVSTSRLAATAHRSKTSNQSTSTTIAASLSSTSTSSSLSTSNNIGLPSGGTKNHNSKVSPPSNAAASRLVEYHQQHVSPRKRILREFEKVSLEDNSAGSSGGKRSRAKSNTTSATSTNSNIVSSTSTTITTNKATGLNAHNSNSASTSKSTAPTKLYSSYSIHSLLGGGLSTSATPTTTAKKSSDLPATITSSSMAYSPYHTASYPSNPLSNNSPKSPESCSAGGGKSPLNSATKSKRSPPYSSPMRETPSKSPSSCGTANYTEYSGRRSPRSTPDTAHNAFNKMRYTSSGGTDTTASPSNHHLHHQHQHHLQQHYQQQPQTYYSPYMMSPHYVPPLSGPNALSPNAAPGNASTSSTASSRSPRHLPSAFRAATPTSASSTTHNIPTTQKGDISPQRSTTASPRETTPRTVPKKTASIRRQFASPTSATTQNHNTSNCSSPITTIDEQLTSDRRTPVNCSTSHQQHQQPQHLLQRSSPGNSSLTGSPIHPYSYLYTQPPNGANSSHTSNAAGSNHLSSAMSSSSAAAVAAAAAAAASYIPAVVGSPYYHPYISTLAAMRHPQMWMQHYQNAAAAAANPALMQGRHPAMLSAAAAAGAAARLSPPYHGFQYNGVGNAATIAAAAAAAAAAGFGSSAVTPPHPSNALPHPSSIFNPMANSSLHGMQHSVTAMQTAGLVPASAAAAALSAVSPMTDTTDLSKSSKSNFYSSTSSSTSTLGFGGSLSTSSGSPGNSMYTISNKDEQSSDVPLNLSKH